VQVLLLVAVHGDGDGRVQAVHGHDRPTQCERVGHQRGVQVAVDADAAALIGDDHRDGGVVAGHLQVEAQVGGIAAHQARHGLGPQLHLLALLVAQSVEQAVGVVHQLCAVLHGLGPQRHLLPLLRPDLVHDSVAVPQRCAHDQQGHRGEHELPPLLAGVEVHGVKFGIR
jgi:hypothetical protein